MSSGSMASSSCSKSHGIEAGVNLHGGVSGGRIPARNGPLEGAANAILAAAKMQIDVPRAGQLPIHCADDAVVSYTTMACGCRAEVLLETLIVLDGFRPGRRNRYFQSRTASLEMIATQRGREDGQLSHHQGALEAVVSTTRAMSARRSWSPEKERGFFFFFFFVFFFTIRIRTASMLLEGQSGGACIPIPRRASASGY